GFDMDYTLALYQQERLEQLSIELTLNKLIQNHGYPEDIRKLKYDPQWAIRGLVVDTSLGNVFKMDRFGFVGRCYHGRRPLAKDERHKIYRTKRIRLSTPRYKWIDTLFGLPEAVMYVTLVDYYDAQPGKPDYHQLFKDIRASIDEAHRDDTLKDTIRADMPAYVHKDDKLAETLHKLRSSGKKLFLLTNSYWPYSNAVMTYLLDGERKAYPSWRNYFDIIIVGGTKPKFFSERNPFYEVETDTGEPMGHKVSELTRGRVYLHGNITDFENMTGVRGDRVIYVGDHIYGDILKLRKSHTWRTAMVLQELELENRVAERLGEDEDDLTLLDRRRRNLDSEIDYQVTMLKRLQKLVDEHAVSDPQLSGRLEEAKKQAKVTLDRYRKRLEFIEEECELLEDSIELAYNPHWGPMFREGNENSRFGQQVSDYADIYTSRVSNLLSYSPMRYFRAPRKKMPHEL
ncbi:MAG: HAD-IG family 5'-nucleotidase, partial [Deltaproteobacteria bacterium]|nr:HAD-IG family 5'-nucleotidase [Deltaproteobacteria bacterium]